MRSTNNLGGFIILIGLFLFVIWFVRYLWWLILIPIIYILIKSIIAPQPSPRETRYERPFEDRTTTNRPRQMDGDVIDAEFEAREIDE